MALATYIEDPVELAELVALQSQPFPLDDIEQSDNAAALFQFTGKAEPDTDRAATPVTCTKYSAAEIALDALLALRESSTTVERLLKAAEREVRADQAFHRCHYLLEPRSKGSRVVCEYKADLLLAAKHVLCPFLLRLYTLLYHRDDTYLRISAKALANSHAHAEIVRLVGEECKRRQLTNFKAYCSEMSTRHHRERGAIHLHTQSRRAAQ